MDINLEYYKVFYYVARKLSFSKASEKLFISQSAVSQSIKLLESKLECTLFLRDTKNVKLTKEGEILYEHIKIAFSTIKKAENIFSQQKQLSQGEIRLASTDTICKYYLLPKIKNFRKEYPSIKIIITNSTSPECLSLLEKASVDFCVVNLPRNLNKKNFTVHTRKMFQDVFIADESYASLRASKVTLLELSKYPLLVLDQKTVTRNFFDTMFESAGLTVSPEIESSNVDLLIEMAKSGLGIAYVPGFCVENMEGSFMIDLDEEMKSRELGLLSLNKLPLSPICEKFIEMMD